jgi:hypothetical protein
LFRKSEEREYMDDLRINKAIILGWLRVCIELIWLELGAYWWVL